jgi:hypothetical protein
MPVFVIEEQMSYEEFLKWQDYFKQRPVGWRGDYRAYQFLLTQGVKEKAWDIFNSLDPILNAKGPDDGKSMNMAQFRKSSMFSRMLGATGGEEVAFEDLE